MDTKVAVLPTVGIGDDLRKLLCKALGIRTDVQWFEVRFAVGEAVTVKCQYIPKVDKAE